jgi:3-oxoadipate enol-lactonase
VNYHYEEHGSGDETIVLAHGLLWSGKMFHKQVAFLKHRYRVITYDHRGQGETELTGGGYDMDTLCADAVALIEALAGKPVIFGGHSMGGMVGMRVAARRPDLVKKLILIDTSAETESMFGLVKYRMLSLILRFFGFAPVVDSVLKIMFSPKFLNDPARKEEKEYWVDQFKGNKPIGSIRASAGVNARKDMTTEIKSIVCATLILVGENDIGTTPANSKLMHSLIPNSQLSIIKEAGHMGVLEEPEAYNKEIGNFLWGEYDLEG